LLRLNAQSQKRYLGFVDEYQPGVEIYYPQYEKITRVHGERRPKVVSLPVYPGYLFAKVDLWGGDIRRLCSLPVRAYWVRFGGNVEAVSDRVIMRLKELEIAGELVREIRYVSPYRHGVSVRVHLPVADLLAVVVKLVGDHAAIVDLPVGRCKVPIHCLEVL